MFQLYEGDSALHRMNPTAKLAALGLVMIGMTLAFDPFVPGLLLIGALAAARILGGVPAAAMARGLVPFAILAFGFFWMQIAFPRFSPETSATLFHVGSFPVLWEAVFVGAALGMRVLAYAGFALLFVATTDPTLLVLSLIQNARLSPRFGYGLLAAYRFFPLYQSELAALRAAHFVRGYDEDRGLRHRFNRWRRYAIPLLAGAVRRAERVAIAMESKGFTGHRSRTYYRETPLGWKDWLLAAAFLSAALGATLAVKAWGGLRLWGGSLYF